MTKHDMPEPIRLPPELLSQVETIAATCERTPDWVVQRALRFYLAGEGSDILAVGRGLQQADAGDLHDMTDMLDDADASLRGDAA